MIHFLSLASGLGYVGSGVCSGQISRSKIIEQQHNLACSGNGSGLGWLKLSVSVRDEAGEVERGYHGDLVCHSGDT